MGADSSVSGLCKFILILSFASFVVCIVGVVSPWWLSQSFMVPNGAGGIPTDANIGLFTSCKELKFPGQTQEDCSAEGAMDWQYVAAAFAIFAVVLGFFSFVANILIVFVSKFKTNKKLQVFSTCINLLSAAGITVSLILYAVNSRIMVDERMPNLLIDFDIDWAYIISIVTAFLYLALFTLNIIDLIMSKKSRVDGVDIDHYVDYQMSIKRQSTNAAARSS